MYFLEETLKYQNSKYKYDMDTIVFTRLGEKNKIK